MEEVWWKQVTKANMFVRDITGALLNDQSVALCTSDHMPWPDTLRELIIDAVNTANFDRTIRVIDGDEAGDDPGAFLLQNYCQSEYRSKYRPGKGGYAKFLADSEGSTLSGVYLWIRRTTPAQLKAWNTFIGDYLGYLGQKIGGVFLLETQNEADIVKKRNLYVYAYDKAIGSFDGFVFTMLLAAEFGSTVYGKQYLAELASQIAGEDIELSAELVRQGENFLADPVGVYDKTLAESGSDFPAKSAEEIEQYVWATQIKLVFPLIEDFRRKLIKKRHSFVQGSLPHPDTAGHMIYDPKEVEVGMLNFLASKDQWPLTYDEWEQLKLHHGARNILAHMGTLPTEELQNLFKAHCV